MPVIKEPVVGPVLPAGRPDQLEVLRQSADSLRGGDRDAVGGAVDKFEASDLRCRGGLETEQADHPVNVDREQRPVFGMSSGMPIIRVR